ncbi:MAG: hypothetical protein WC683_07875 [bacterium]
MSQPGPINSFPLRSFPGGAFPAFTSDRTPRWSAVTPAPVWNGTITAPAAIAVSVEIQVMGGGDDGIAARFPMGE